MAGDVEVGRVDEDLEEASSAFVARGCSTVLCLVLALLYPFVLPAVQWLGNYVRLFRGDGLLAASSLVSTEPRVLQGGSYLDKAIFTLVLDLDLIVLFLLALGISSVLAIVSRISPGPARRYVLHPLVVVVAYAPFLLVAFLFVVTLVGTYWGIWKESGLWNLVLCIVFFPAVVAGVFLRFAAVGALAIWLPPWGMALCRPGSFPREHFWNSTFDLTSGLRAPASRRPRPGAPDPT